MVAGDWQPYVPAATIGRPRTAGEIVGRPAVLHRLLGAAGGDLVVVSAPTGYGKSTAVALWDDADERPFAWVRVDHLDDDPAHLLLHLATAVDQLRGVGRDMLRYLRGPGRAPLTHLVPAMVQVLEACGPLVVVLDDVHELSAPEAIDTLRALIDAAPASTTFAVVSRCPPSLDVARRRLQHGVVELGIDELRFSCVEAAAALESVSGSSDEATVTAVFDICEGWAAGLILAAMALRDGAAVEDVTGRHNLVVDYLMEQVLDRLDDDTCTFLVESSVLDRFSAEQLDDMLERDDSSRMLAKLSKSGNLFLISLDQQGIYYRYHRLFGDVLRGRLCSAAPGRHRELACRPAQRRATRGAPRRSSRRASGGRACRT